MAYYVSYRKETHGWKVIPRGFSTEKEARSKMGELLLSPGVTHVALCERGVDGARLVDAIGVHSLESTVRRRPNTQVGG